MSPKYILGISAYYHDSAAALIQDGDIIAAAHEERFTRKKHDPGFPNKAIAYVLKEAAIEISDIHAVVFYDKPFLKFERLLETYHAFAPRGILSFLTAIPVWIKEKLFMRSIIEKELQGLIDTHTHNGSIKSSQKIPPLYFAEHHLSHSASAFYPSPFEDAAILTIDGVGEWATTSIFHGNSNNIKVLKEIHFPHSLGLLYSAFTAYCGFKVNSGEYKLMGLAPYGNPDAQQTQEFEKKIRDELIDIRDDGSYILNMKYFQYATGLRMYHKARWQKLFEIPERTVESEDISQEYMNMALAIQKVTEDIVIKLARTAKAITGSDNLCLAGGVALNCVANGKLLREDIFKNIWIQPAAGDAGGALGAALAWWHLQADTKRIPNPNDSMQGSYLGPSFEPAEIAYACKKFKAPYTIIENEDDLSAQVANLLAEGKVVGWFQGRMEYGPRALGNRSILGDPRNVDMQKRLNLKIKYREGFRPFAPAVLEEHAKEYFDLKCKSPYMILVAAVNERICHAPPDSYNDLSLWDRLYVTRSDLPAITHVDYSARIQTVSYATNPRYYKLIEAFNEKYACPVIVNTSFNVRGEPIVCSPDDAYLCFMRTEMDYLVMDNFILDKKAQPQFDDAVNWRKQYVLD